MPRPSGRAQSAARHKFVGVATDVQMNRFGERLNKLHVPTLLILDEVGCMPLDQVATSFLFQLASKRYTRGVIITNKRYMRAIYCLLRWTHDRPIRPPKNQRGGL